MKYRRRKRLGRQNKLLRRFLGGSLVLLLIATYFFNKIRPLVIQNAISCAETLFLTAAEESVVTVLAENDVTYEDIVMLSRTAEGSVTSVETDVVKINTLKSMISQTLAHSIAEKEYYEVEIPIGTLLSHTYIGGWGPRIRFKMQVTATARVNFSQEFKAAGINQVLHVVSVDMNISGGLVMLGACRNLSVSTSVFAAQTLIVGEVPNAFTEVTEAGDSNLAGTINDYGAVPIP